jgi:DNA-binding MarR family transcriptional regulator
MRPLPALLQTGLGAYRMRMQTHLAAAGYRDLPRGGPYVLGTLANQGGTAGDVIRQLGVSKQAASKLIDTLVVRGYLERAVERSDRRRFALAVTDQGRAAASVVRGAVASVDAELAARLSPDELAALRKGLAVLAEIAEAA